MFSHLLGKENTNWKIQLKPRYELSWLSPHSTGNQRKDGTKDDHFLQDLIFMRFDSWALERVYTKYSFSLVNRPCSRESKIKTDKARVTSSDHVVIRWSPVHVGQERMVLRHKNKIGGLSIWLSHLHHTGRGHHEKENLSGGPLVNFLWLSKHSYNLQFRALEPNIQNL